ncbi:MAG: 3-isopropylmalate dehydratase [bacterium]|nr:3-isopropylmalate dehydratase [Candidatus Sumerlaeota bacterium]
MPKVVFKVGDDISTDTIYPGRFMATVLPTETPQHCFADYKEFNDKANRKELPEGGIILAGNNFGCGSSREQAASCIKGHGLTVVARGIARIFLQNAVNLGLNTIIAPDVVAGEGDELALEKGALVNKTTGKSFAIVPHAPARQAIIDAAGLIPYARRKLMEQHGKRA